MHAPFGKKKGGGSFFLSILFHCLLSSEFSWAHNCGNLAWWWFHSRLRGFVEHSNNEMLINQFNELSEGMLEERRTEFGGVSQVNLDAEWKICLYGLWCALIVKRNV